MKKVVIVMVGVMILMMVAQLNNKKT